VIYSLKYDKQLLSNVHVRTRTTTVNSVVNYHSKFSNFSKSSKYHVAYGM